MRMISTVVALSLFALPFIGSAHADRIKRITPPPPFEATNTSKVVCYYEVDGFTYHYVIDKKLFVPVPPCAETIETPLVRIPQGWAVLLKHEMEGHDEPLRLCYYGMRGHRLFIQTVGREDGCLWARPDEEHEPTSGTAELRHEEDAAGGTDSRLCLYRLGFSSVRFTHYVMLSKYTKCPQRLPVGQ